jgi:hypothetical protein
MEHSNRYVDGAIIAVFSVMLVLTTLIAWYRLVVTENFRYVLDENDTPATLDLSTY